MRRTDLTTALALTSLVAGVWLLPGPTGSVKAGIEPPVGHGMLVVGQQRIYLSHLPLYSPHHRYQVILEVDFKAEGSDPAESYRQDRQAEGNLDRVYTLSPRERFVLPNQVLQLKSFQADVFRGHFERAGNERILEDVTVEIRRVVHFHQFKTNDASNEGDYILFGGGAEIFAAHWIGRKPSFDHVLRVESVSRELSDEALSSGVLVRAAARLEPEREIQAELEDFLQQPFQVQLKTGKQIYLEEAELQ